MRRIATFLILGFLFIPNLTFAATEACSKKGYTIATVNGVFTDQKGAEANLRALKDIGGQEYKGEIVEYQYFLNASHLAGLGDGLKAFKQKVEDGVAADDYDLIEMVKDASAKVTTRKLLLVARSQGNFYANSFYEKVTGKDTPSSRGLDTSPLKRGRGGGVPLESIGMYSVATPSNHVSGGGTYLTSTSDKVIAGVVGSMPLFKIMTPNTDIELKEGDDTWGHNFSDVYLKYRAAQIVSDIEWSLGRLKADDTTPPQSSPLKRGGGEDTTTPPPPPPPHPPPPPPPPPPAVAVHKPFLQVRSYANLQLAAHPDALAAGLLVHPLAASAEDVCHHKTEYREHQEREHEAPQNSRTCPGSAPHQFTTVSQTLRSLRY